MLPKPPKPEDPDELTPEEALIRQLEEYRQFKEVSARMHQLEEDARALIVLIALIIFSPFAVFES